MSSQERMFQGGFRRLLAWIGILLLAMLVASCGGGSGSSAPGNNTANTTTTSSTSPSTQSPASVELKANAGPVCETLLKSEKYTSTLPALSCNKATDKYTAVLNGANSYTSNGEPFTYSWSFDARPAGSQAVLQGADTARPTFVPDVAGAYAVQLVIKAGGQTSPRSVTMVVALSDAILNPDPMTNPAATTYHYHGGLSGSCGNCHAASIVSVQPKPSTHMPTSNACQTCHTTEGFNTTPVVDHKEVFGKCSDCHNGVVATGKSSSHIPTTQECSDCHNTTSFLTLSANGTFDHSNITEPCSACHNGKTAMGTEADTSVTGHPGISVECNACHSTTTFKTPFIDHANTSVVVPGTCGQAGCHDGQSTANGVVITGKASAPNPHPDTGNITTACDQCHNTTSFNMNGEFDHGVLARHPIACKSCHDGVNAKGKIANHIPTSATSDCSNCHNTSTFVGGFVDHTTSAVTSKKCTDCHNNNGTYEWTPTDSSGNPQLDASGNPVRLPVLGPPTSPQKLADIHTANSTQSCGNCHTPGGSFNLATIDHSGFGTVGAITLPSGETCSDCHDGATTTGKPSGHLATTEDCGACHDPQSDNWAGAGFDHSSLAIAGNTSTPSCLSCHDGSAATGQSTSHVPTSGQDCLVCHGTGFTSFSMPTFDHGAAGITSNCVSCHDGQTHDSVVVIAKPAGHIPTAGDCSVCHSATTNGPGINGTSSSGFATADPFVNTVHPAYSTGCRNCHSGGYDNALYNAQKHPVDSTHDTVDKNGWECSVCHTTTGNFKETNPVNHADPLIQSQQCIGCHADRNTVEPIGRSASHPNTSDQCQECHQAGGSFTTVVFDHSTLVISGGSATPACSTCHDGTTATGKTPNHVPTTRDCISCHMGYPPSATSFVGGTFDHTGPEMTGRQCMDCHDGNIATGKTPTHIATSQDCGACHTTDSFANATSFDHTGVTSGCADSGCHNEGNPSVTDVTDDPNSLPHIPIKNNGVEVDCYSCHKSPGGTFANASMDHSLVGFEGCESCHDGRHDGANSAHVATAQPAGHIAPSTSTSYQTVNMITTCATCHQSTSDWTQVQYTHRNSSASPPGYYPGNHSTRKVTSCTQCHNDSPPTYQIKLFDTAPYYPYCAGCHLNQYRDGHGGTPDSKHYDCGKSGCHNVGSSSFG